MYINVLTQPYIHAFTNIDTLPWKLIKSRHFGTFSEERTAGVSLIQLFSQPKRKVEWVDFKWKLPQTTFPLFHSPTRSHSNATKQKKRDPRRSCRKANKSWQQRVWRKVSEREEAKSDEGEKLESNNYCLFWKEIKTEQGPTQFEWLRAGRRMRVRAFLFNCHKS